MDKFIKKGLIKDTFKLLNITPKSKQRKLQINARELQERIHNNRNPKEYVHVYNMYGERELLKQIRYELDNLGNFEKIKWVPKPHNNQDSDSETEYTDNEVPDDLSDFRSDIGDTNIGVKRIVDTIDESDREFTVRERKLRKKQKSTKSPTVKQVALKSQIDKIRSQGRNWSFGILTFRARESWEEEANEKSCIANFEFGCREEKFKKDAQEYV